jgi:hypothetical protein
MFFSMARNLVDGPGFGVWLAKLWEFDSGLTIKYVHSNATRFGHVSKAQFNELARVNGAGRHCL